jgi:recyclin-1
MILKDRSESVSMLNDKERMQAHKRMVMDTMKSIMFAPMILTKTLIQSGFKTVRTSSGNGNSPLIDSESSPDPESPAFQFSTHSYDVDDSSLGSLISLELSLNLMHMNKESLGRALVITSLIDESLMYLFLNLL